MSGDWGGRCWESKRRRRRSREKRRGVDRASFKSLYRGNLREPVRPQTNPELRSCSTHRMVLDQFFSRQLRARSPYLPWGLAPGTQHRAATGDRPCVAATVGPGSRLWGEGPNGANGALLQPTLSLARWVWGTGVATALACLAAIHHEESSSSQGERKKRHLLSTLVGRVSPFQSQSLQCMQTSGPDTAKRSPIPPFQDLGKGPGKGTMHRLMLTRYPCIKQVSQNTQHFSDLQHLLFDFCPCVTRALHNPITCSSGSRS